MIVRNPRQSAAAVATEDSAIIRLGNAGSGSSTRRITRRFTRERSLVRNQPRPWLVSRFTPRFLVRKRTSFWQSALANE
jgi:hypothetical protein